MWVTPPYVSSVTVSERPVWCHLSFPWTWGQWVWPRTRHCQTGAEGGRGRKEGGGGDGQGRKRKKNRGETERWERGWEWREGKGKKQEDEDQRRDVEWQSQENQLTKAECVHSPKGALCMYHTWVVSWSTRWVYLVLPALPKSFTCITFGSTVLSKWSSRVAWAKSRL